VTASSNASAHEVAQAQALAKARRRATGLLAAVAVGFLASFALPDAAWTGWVRAALEAGLVGGLADWFAVVALFRHPLGIPIPRTAVIPNSKAGLGTNLAAFVRDNFLQDEQVVERVADPAHIDRLGVWLAEPEHAERVAAQVAGLALSALDGLEHQELVDRIVAGMRTRLEQIPVSTLAGEALQEAIRERRHVALVDSTLEGLRAALVHNRQPLRRRLGQQSPSWVPEFVDDLVFERADEVVRSFLSQVVADPKHEVRAVLDEQLLGLTKRMQTDPALQARVNGALHDAIDDDQLRTWVISWWAEVRARLLAASDPSKDGGALRQLVIDAILDLGGRLQGDEALRERVLGALRSAAPRLAQTGQQEIAGIIASTIDRWNAEETSQRLETWMGPDLQFVRINGTLVGALVGVLLHAVTTLLS
jgi:uncharacterized membrane-anchored protein YjiN (DUF445 family)